MHDRKLPAAIEAAIDAYVNASHQRARARDDDDGLSPHRERVHDAAIRAEIDAKAALVDAVTSHLAPAASDPVAWAVMQDARGVEWCAAAFLREHDAHNFTGESGAKHGMRVVPLYAAQVAPAAPLTVGAFLAFGHVAEFRMGPEWWQTKPGGACRMWRPDAYGGPKWSWWIDNAVDHEAIASTACRLVHLDDADRDPASRGPL